MKKFDENDTVLDKASKAARTVALGATTMGFAGYAAGVGLHSKAEAARHKIENYQISNDLEQQASREAKDAEHRADHAFNVASFMVEKVALPSYVAGVGVSLASAALKRRKRHNHGNDLELSDETPSPSR